MATKRFLVVENYEDDIKAYSFDNILEVRNFLDKEVEEYMNDNGYSDVILSGIKSTLISLKNLNSVILEIPKKEMELNEENKKNYKTTYDFVAKEKSPILKEILSLFQTKMDEMNKNEKEYLDIYPGQISNIINNHYKKYEAMEKEQKEKSQTSKKRNISNKFLDEESKRIKNLKGCMGFLVFEELKYHMRCADICSKLFNDIHNLDPRLDLAEMIEKEGFEERNLNLSFDLDKIKEKKRKNDEKNRTAVYDDSNDNMNEDETFTIENNESNIKHHSKKHKKNKNSKEETSMNFKNNDEYGSDE